MGVYRVLAGVHDFDSMVTRCERQVHGFVVTTCGELFHWLGQDQDVVGRAAQVLDSLLLLKAVSLQEQLYVLDWVQELLL